MEAAFLLGLMPDQAQDDVFGSNPDARVTSVIAPTGSAKPVEGGVTVSGRWAFNSGSVHGDWALLALLVHPNDADPYPALALIPYVDMTIIYDWHTSGLGGTGSNSVTASDVFVPEHRVMLFSDVLLGKCLSVQNERALLWRSHPAAFLFAGGIAVSIGLAKGAMDEFTTRLPGRGITYSNYPSQLDAPLTHLQFGGAYLRVEAAEFHGRRAADIVDSAARSGAQISLLDRAHVRGEAGRSIELCTEAVDLLDSASGASSIMRAVPIQRYGRDMRALYRHALYYPPINTELYGRVLLGLEPNSHFL
jgi:3-hydroxy-9,10-secoandrosta-1,3,5(10)-triene-9,17-dione monooxygenase